MNKIFTFEKLTDTAAAWALEQVADKHPLQNRTCDLHELVNSYEYNRFGDIIDERAEHDSVKSDKLIITATKCSPGYIAIVSKLI